MSEDTLNEKLYEAISSITATAYGDIEGRTEAANECEKIALQEQIDLLKNIYDYGCKIQLSESAGYFLLRNEVYAQLQSLTNKLSELVIKNNK